MLRRRPAIPVLTFLVLSSLLASARLPAQEADSRPARAADVRPGVLDEAWRTVKKSFYDKNLHGVDWEAVREKYRPRAETAGTQAEVHAVINEMLAELKASHLVVVEKDIYLTHFVPEFAGKKTLRPGFEVRLHDGRYFAHAIIEGGPATRAGLHLGDEIVSINGLPPAECPDLADAGSDPGIVADPHLVCRVVEGRPVRLEVRRTRGGEPVPLEIMPEKTSMVAGSRASVRVEERRGIKLGVIHLWHFLSAEMGILMNRAVKNEFQEADGLLLDIRGRGGSPFVMNAVLSAIRPRGAWKKPVVLLIDEGSRSAKEVFAWLFRKERLGTVVGRKTPGAVLGSTFVVLSDGSALLMPVMDVKNLTGGKSLEGKGVAPDIEVTEPDEYLDGRDPIFEKGMDVLRRACLIEKSA
ncbi:MAG: hypothetical protein HYY93_05490 [Planctomycetes bacterium]|nr:hypothetical protein [Planctomycetota bacterium]